MSKQQLKQGDLVEHDKFEIRGIVKEVTKYRKNGRPRLVKVLWFPLGPDADWKAVAWLDDQTRQGRSPEVSTLTLHLISSAADKALET